jgi:hypothetical protein
MLPVANTTAMQLHLDEISLAVAPGSHDVVIMDRAGWHETRKLAVPENLTIILLPARSPELNPPYSDCLQSLTSQRVENIWQYLRQNWLSNRVFQDFDAILDAGCDAWNRLMALPDTIRSIGWRDWAHTGR